MTPPELPGGVIVVARGEAIGTTWSVCAVHALATSADISRAVESCLKLVVRQMSPWAADSDITRFNLSAGGAWTAVPADFATVLEAALAVADASGGAFDPTIGAVVDLWGFGPPGPAARPPSRMEVEEALGPSGWRRLQYDGGRIHQPGGLRLDFSGIAKGYAVDLVCDALVALGCDSFLVEIGGELRGCGVKPDGHPWWVDIETPPESLLEPSRLALLDLAIATSGDYRRTLSHAGRQVSHTLDPRTGHPVTHGLASVTVVHNTAMMADVEATAITVLGPEAGYDYAVRRDLAALLVERQGDGWRERITPRLNRMAD